VVVVKSRLADGDDVDFPDSEEVVVLLSSEANSKGSELLGSSDMS
jgi:hypothetical protein